MSIAPKACSFTGYRPNKFDFDFTCENSRFMALENKLIETVFSMPKENCRDFYCGMAWGFDILAGETVVMLKKMCPNEKIRLIAVVPFEGQEKSWSTDWQQRYHRLLKAADRIVYISNNYTKDCYHKRNRYMVDNSDTVITFFDGKSGGTAATLRYAKTKQKQIINIAEVTDTESLYFSPYIICDDEDI